MLAGLWCSVKLAWSFCQQSDTERVMTALRRLVLNSARVRHHSDKSHRMNLRYFFPFSASLDIVLKVTNVEEKKRMTFQKG